MRRFLAWLGGVFYRRRAPVLGEANIKDMVLTIAEWMRTSRGLYIPPTRINRVTKAALAEFVERKNTDKQVAEIVDFIEQRLLGPGA